MKIWKKSRISIWNVVPDESYDHTKWVLFQREIERHFAIWNQDLCSGISMQNVCDRWLAREIMKENSCHRIGFHQMFIKRKSEISWNKGVTNGKEVPWDYERNTKTKA